MKEQKAVTVHQAKVTDNQDPDGLGRIRLSICTVEGGADIESDWLPVITPFAGNESGLFSLPEVDDIVAAMFFDSSFQDGIVLGCFYNESLPPPKTEENSDGDLNDDGNNSLHFVRSRSGLRIILDDTDGEEKIQLLSTDAKTRFEILVGDELINIETDKDLFIGADGVISIAAEELSITTEKAMDISCDSAQCESSKDISIEGSSNLTLEGQTIKLN